MPNLLSVTLTVIASCFFTAASVFAQADFRKGFYINATKDSVFGLMNFHEGDVSFESCEFKTSEAAEKITYLPKDILGYGFTHNKSFETKTIELTPGTPIVVFAETLLRGYVSLYNYKGIFFIEKEGSMIRLSYPDIPDYQNGFTTVRKSHQHVGILSATMNDCPEIKTKIEAVNVSEKNFIKIVSEYNKCKNSPSVVLNRGQRGTAITFGGFVGVTSTSISFTPGSGVTYHYLDGPWKASTSFTCGFTLDISAKAKQSFAIVSGLWLANSSFTSGTTKISMTDIKLPLMFRYKLPDKKVTPYISAGIPINYHLSKKDETSNSNSSYKEAIGLTNFDISLLCAIGIMTDNGPKSRFFAEFRYESFTGVSDFVYLATKLTSVQLVVGLRGR